MKILNEKVCFSVKEIITLLDSGKLKRGDCLIMDEIAGEGEQIQEVLCPVKMK